MLSTFTVSENGGTATVRAIISPPAPEAFTVTVSAVAVDPVVAGDFILRGDTLAFAAGANESTGEVTVTALDNDEEAPAKAVTVTGMVSIAGVGAPEAVTLTITDDDGESAAPPVSKVTLASLADLGYEIDYAVAEPYPLPVPNADPDAASVLRIGAGGGLRKSIAVAELPAGLTPFVNGD